jgi:hypothetical protein
MGDIRERRHGYAGKKENVYKSLDEIPFNKRNSCCDAARNPHTGCRTPYPGAIRSMKTYVVAIFLFSFNVLASIACGMGLVSVAGSGLQTGFVEMLVNGLLNSTVQLPIFLASLGISKSFAGIVAFATWFVYAVGFFQLVTARVIGLEG